MPIFAQLFAAMFGALTTFLARMFAFRLAVRIAAVASIGALGTALVATFNQAVAPLAAALFATQYGQLLGLAFPPVAGTCLGVLSSLWLACTTYKLQVEAIKVTAGI